MFFFHVHGEGTRVDGEGRNFPDARAALHWARVLFDTVLHRSDSRNQWIEIADAQGVPIACVPFRNALAGNAGALARISAGV